MKCWRATGRTRVRLRALGGTGDLMEFDLEQSLDILGRSPAVLRALLSRLPEPWIRGTEGPDTFSPFDNVGHLIDGEETDWIPRAKLILARGPSEDQLRSRDPV